MEPQRDAIEPRLVKIEEAARALSISPATCYRLVACGEIATVRFGRARRVPVAELDRLIQRSLERVSLSDPAAELAAEVTP